MNLIVYVEPHILDQVHGQWCECCLLPSVTELSYVAVNTETLRPLWRGVARECDSCGSLPLRR